MGIGPLDAAILGLYLLGVVCFGFLMGRGQRSAADFMVAGRSLPWWVVLFSIVATETSTVTFLSIPGFAYGKDLTWLQLPLGFLVGRFVVVALLLPHYFEGELFTAYDVLERRFGGRVKQVSSVLFIVTRSLADGLRLFLTAIVLQEVTGLSLSRAVVVIGIATIAYTFFGGMRAVLWTDLVQFIVYIGGALIALDVLLGRIPGGWHRVLTMAAASHKLRVFDFRLDFTDPYVFWAGVLGGLFLTLGSHGADQMMVQRYLCARNLKGAGRALWASGVVILAQFALFLVIGVALYCFYQIHPPLVPFDRTDRVFARFIVDELPPGALGLVLGAVFAAAMSTLSSSLNSSATAAFHDLLRPSLLRRASPRTELAWTRALTAGFGLVQIGVGIAGRWLDATVVAGVLAIAGFTTGIILGVFFLGILTRRVGQTAALVGLVLGLAGMTAVYLFTPLAWPWYALVGSLGTFGLGLAASRVLDRRQPAQ